MCSCPTTGKGPEMWVTFIHLTSNAGSKWWGTGCLCCLRLDWVEETIGKCRDTGRRKRQRAGLNRSAGGKKSGHIDSRDQALGLVSHSLSFLKLPKFLGSLNMTGIRFSTVCWMGSEAICCWIWETAIFFHLRGGEILTHAPWGRHPRVSLSLY